MEATNETNKTTKQQLRKMWTTSTTGLYRTMCSVHNGVEVMADLIEEIKKRTDEFTMLNESYMNGIRTANFATKDSALLTITQDDMPDEETIERFDTDLLGSWSLEDENE